MRLFLFIFCLFVRLSVCICILYTCLSVQGGIFPWKIRVASPEQGSRQSFKIMKGLFHVWEKSMENGLSLLESEGIMEYFRI